VTLSSLSEGERAAVSSGDMVQSGMAHPGRHDEQADGGEAAPRRPLSSEEFASLVTHELRNPLNAMSGWLHLLSADTARRPEGGERALAGLKRALDQQVEQVELLGRLLRLLGGADTDTGGPVDLHEAIDGCLRTLTPSAHAAGRKIVLQRTPGTNVWTHGHVDATGAALRSLCAFALRHGVPGAPLLVTQEVRGGAPFVRLRIDEGPGSGMSIWHAFGTGTARLALDLLHATLAIESQGGRVGPCGDGRIGDELGIRFEPARNPPASVSLAGGRLA
jgi:signal transduction histidine kinase